MNTPNMSEEDMGFVTEIFQKIANALVMSTEFPKQISDMKADLASLHTDLEITKGRNAELDALLHDTRRQRDEAEQALSQAKNELATTKYNLDEANRSLVNSQGGVDKLLAELEQTKKDRDDYGMKQMEAEERAKLAEAKLAKLAEALGLPKTEAKPEPPLLNPYPTPAEMNQPEPGSKEPKRVYEGETGFDSLIYTSDKRWDELKCKWYRVEDKSDDMPF